MNMPLFASNPEEIVLRDYQEKAITEIRDSFRKNKAVVCQLATGSGKSILAAYMIKKAMEKGLRCAFVVDRLTLLDQISAIFAKYGIPHGVIQGNHSLTNNSEPIQICSIATLRRRIYEPFEFIVIDECHCFHNQHEKMVRESKFALGLSASPWRAGLGKHFTDLISPVTMTDLMARGYLTEYDVLAPQTINVEGVKIVAGDYKESELAERSDTVKITGDIVSHWKKHASDRKTICFCVNVAHARHVAREFNRQGIKAVEVNAYQDNNAEILREYTHGAAKVICSVDILGRGFDHPETSCAILARPTKSKMVFVQQVGRILRPGGHDRALVLDHAGNFPRLGFVEDFVNIPLNDGKNKRGKNDQKEKPEKLPKPCPSCDFLKPAGVHVCPACNFEPENIRDVEVEAGELTILKRQKKAKKDFSIAEKTVFLASLNAYAASKNMRRTAKGIYGWAIHQYKAKFGCVPSNQISWTISYGIIDDNVKKFITYQNIKRAKS